MKKPRSKWIPRVRTASFVALVAGTIIAIGQAHANPTNLGHDMGIDCIGAAEGCLNCVAKLCMQTFGIQTSPTSWQWTAETNACFAAGALVCNDPIGQPFPEPVTEPVGDPVVPVVPVVVVDTPTNPVTNGSGSGNPYTQPYAPNPYATPVLVAGGVAVLGYATVQGLRQYGYQIVLRPSLGAAGAVGVLVFVAVGAGTAMAAGMEYMYNNTNVGTYTQNGQTITAGGIGTGFSECTTASGQPGQIQTSALGATCVALPSGTANPPQGVCEYTCTGDCSNIGTITTAESTCNAQKLGGTSVCGKQTATMCGAWRAL